MKRRPQHAVGSRRALPPLEGSSNVREIVPTLDSAKKILDILEGKRVITPPVVLPVLREPAVEALEAHPLAQDQAKYLSTNLRRFKQKRKKAEEAPAGSINNQLFARVIRDLPDDKQKSLLQTLSKISKSLEFGGLVLHEDEAGVVSSPVLKSKTIAEPLSANASIKSSLLLRDDANSSLHGGGSIGGSSVGDEANSAHISVTDSYASAKSYGVAKPDMAHAESVVILDRIGAGMFSHPEAEQHYDLSGRGGVELVSPTALVARVQAEFKVHISTSEIAILMRKFDVDHCGVVNIIDVLGSAKNIHSKTIYLDSMDELQRESQVQRKLLLERRAEYRVRMGGKEPDGSTVVGTAKKDTMHSIIDKLSIAAYEAIRTKALRPLNTCRPKLFPVEFKALLVELNCQLSTREAFVLERRYFQGQTGTVDAGLFRAEFVALGKDMIRDSRRVDAMQSFVRAVSRGGADSRGGVAGGGGDDQSLGQSLGSSSSVTADSSTTAALGFSNQEETKNKALALTDLGQVSSVVKNQMSVELADEWISDPLQPNKPSARSAKSPKIRDSGVGAREGSPLGKAPPPRSPLSAEVASLETEVELVKPISRSTSRASSRGRPHSVTFCDEPQVLSVPTLDPLPFSYSYSSMYEENFSGNPDLPFAVVPSSPVSDGGFGSRGSSRGSRGGARGVKFEAVEKVIE